MTQPAPRFLTLDQVAEELATTTAQIYALVRRGELPALKLGGRGQWRVERARLEEYIERLYGETEQYIKDNPLTGGDE
jgi:excisionase family DNA binding protein